MSAPHIPSTMQALQIIEKAPEGSTMRVAVKETAVPTLGDNEVLIKTAWVSQNPTDWKHAAFEIVGVPGSISGCDYSGTVVALGKNCRQDLKIGDKVASFVHGGKFADKGSFAEYLKAESDLVWKIPSSGSVGLREAPNYGIGFTTAAQVLYRRQFVPYPPEKVSGDKWYLVYGGSTSVGLYAIQLAKLAGFKVVTTCSPRNNDLVKSYGADEVVDYKDTAAAVEKIHQITNNSLTLALDCISEGSSFDITIPAVNGQGEKKIDFLLGVPDEWQAKAKETGIKTEVSLAYSLLGLPVQFMPTWGFPAIPEDRELYVRMNKDMDRFINEWNVRPNPVKERGHLEDIPAGFEEMKEGKVSAQKLHYRIDRHA